MSARPPTRHEVSRQLRELARDLFWARAANEDGDERLADERIRDVEDALLALAQKLEEGGS